MNKIFHILVLTSVYCTYLHAPLVIGDSQAATGETFSFDVGFASFDIGSELSFPRLWTATNDPAMNTKSDDVKQYGLSLTNQLSSYVGANVRPIAIPMTNPENAVTFAFNGTTAVIGSIPNPMWGGTFAFFDVSIQKPIFTVTAELNKIYAVENISRYKVTDEKHQNTTDLLVHDFGNGQEVKALLASLNEIYAAHAIGTFGADDTSKIALLVRSTLTSEQGTVPYLRPIADTSLTTTTPALSGGLAPLLELCPSVTISHLFGVVYVGVDATASLGSMASGMTIAQLNPVNADGTGGFFFKFIQIAPTSVLNPGFDTVISATSCNEIRIKNITGIKTSTGLDYVIVARDNGAGPQTIYALPILSAGAHMGEIADFTSLRNNFGSVYPYLFASRQFTKVISDASQIDPTGPFATQLLVGAGPLPLDAGNSIKSLHTTGDSVYAVIGDAYTATQSPGTWRSQAIFAQDGHIIGWSAWSRVLGSDEQMNYSTIDRKTISGFYVSHVTTNFRAVHETTFVTDSYLAPFLTVAQTPVGGIQGLFDFPQSTPGFNNSLSLMLSTGFDNVTIGQTSAIQGGILKSLAMTSTDVISFSDLNIPIKGALIASDIAHNGPNHWIFVGGMHGVSVLTGDGTGYSWTGNLPNIAALNAGQTWKTVGDFSSVKKLAWDQTYIYILTSTQLYRIALDPNKFLATPTAPLDTQLVVSSFDVADNSYFLDMLIDDGFILLGTTNGLFTLHTSTKKSVQIQIPNGLPAISRLIAISPNQEPQRTFKTLSNLDILTSSFGTQQTRLNRFVIQDSVLTPFDDFLNSNSVGIGSATSFIKFDNYMSNYFTDGAWNLASSYSLGINQPSDTHPTPLIQQIFAGIRTGFPSSQIIMPKLSGYAPIPFAKEANNLGGFVRENVTGSLILFGNFAALANV
ncbi:MAG TPA: hypothetical protein VLG50_02870 [Candidatus Saccharimonadales bacterium]|nr:hypothetical protein [Candidatus Saccharimonadales bacterium]